MSYQCREQPWEQTIWEDHLSRLSILLTKASYSNKLAALLDSELLKLVTSQEPHLAQRVTDIAMTYCNNVVTSYASVILMIEADYLHTGSSERRNHFPGISKQSYKTFSMDMVNVL